MVESFIESVFQSPMRGKINAKCGVRSAKCEMSGLRKHNYELRITNYELFSTIRGKIDIVASWKWQVASFGTALRL